MGSDLGRRITQTLKRPSPVATAASRPSARLTAKGRAGSLARPPALPFLYMVPGLPMMRAVRGQEPAGRCRGHRTTKGEVVVRDLLPAGFFLFPVLGPGPGLPARISGRDGSCGPIMGSNPITPTPKSVGADRARWDCLADESAGRMVRGHRGWDVVRTELPLPRRKATPSEAAPTLIPDGLTSTRDDDGIRRWMAGGQGRGVGGTGAESGR